ncbi:ribonuclease III [Paracrocinitomix mangrovi]|uniref:ribonuclease III n=1 Tax=Paracrocinitomix mangrovi TaxID=2862509 RepID=UPI001EDBEA57|nr:ribonuclease III [Paracrocinitomix mangrovi]UKN00640.1 ribonuclease III [Paracrocinitomix mangrovi]
MLRLFLGKKRSKGDLAVISFMVKKFGYRPKDLELFTRALTHKSYSNTKDELKSNERLEYLGDTVIDLIVADYLFDKFPDKDEGFLTKVKAKIVNRKMLAAIGAEIGIAKHIRYKTGRSIRIATIEGNAFEALIGAIYLDSNFEITKKVFNTRIIRNYINLNEVLEQEIDFKSALLIWGQKNKLQIEYRITEEASRENDYLYTSVVVINDKKWGLGKGKSKKEAEQQASNETLELLGLQ